MKKLTLFLLFFFFVAFPKHTEAAWYSLSSPANGSTLLNAYPTFTWSADLTGMSYTNICFYSNTQTCGSGACYGANQAAKNFVNTPSGMPLNANRYYAWDVYGCGSGCATSNCYWFRTNRYLAYGPVNGTTTSSAAPTFTWDADTTGYIYNNICIGTDSTCNGLSCSWGPSISARSYTLPSNLNYNTTYYWVIYGCSSGCALVGGSGCQSFRTPSCTPSCSGKTCGAADGCGSTCTSGSGCCNNVANTSSCYDTTSCTATTCGAGTKSQSCIDTAPSCPNRVTVNNVSCYPNNFSKDTTATLKNNLVAYWSFDELAGATIATDSATYNKATYTGSTISSLGGSVQGTASRYFNGSSNAYFLKQGNISSFTQMSVSTWVYPLDCAHGSSGHNTVLALENGILVAFNNSCQLANYVVTGGAWRGPDGNGATIPLNKWTHIVVTWDGVTLRTYVNGSLVPGSGTAAPGAWGTTYNYYYMGARPDCCTQTLNGYIDEMGIWSKALSATEVANLYSNGVYGGAFSGLTNYWNMDEGTSATGASDSVGGINGTVIGAPTLVNPAKPGLGYAKNYGQSQGLNLGSAMTWGNTFTASAWIRPNVLINYAGILSKDTAARDGNGYSLMLVVHNNGTIGSYSSTVNWGFSNATGITAGSTWYHVAWVLSGGTMYFYVNGNPVGSRAFTYTEVAGHNSFIGTWYAPSNVYDFNGAIDEVGFWKRALSTAEIQELYNSGSGKTLTTNGFRTGNRFFNQTSVNVTGTVSFADSTTPHTVNLSSNLGAVSGSVMPWSYTLPVAANSSYTITPSAVNGPPVSYNTPANLTGTAICSNITGQNFVYTVSCSPSPISCEAWGPCNTTTRQRTRVCHYSGGCPDLPQTASCALDAGVVIAGLNGATITSGTGNISTQGSGAGFRLPSYARSTPITGVTYSALMANVFKNANISQAFLETKTANGFDATTGYSVNSGGVYYRFWRLSTSTSLDTLLGSVINYSDPYNSINVIVPTTVAGSDPKSSLLVTARDLSASSKNIVLFVNGNLDISANMTMGTNSSLVVILNNAGGSDVGNLTLYQPVTRLDGIYIFPGLFNDAYGPQLTAYGALIATNVSTNLGLGFQRYNDAGPAELWYYQPKYLSLYSNVLSIPNYNWSEISPQ